MQAETGTPLSEQAPGPAAHRGARRHLGLWSLVALGVYVLDQTTKWLAQDRLTVGVPRDVVGDWLRLDLTHNAGAAFSMGTGYTIVLTVLAIAVIVVTVRMAG